MLLLAAASLLFAGAGCASPAPAPAPSTPPAVAGPGEHCGGNIATALGCTAGYHCAPAAGSHLPFGDVGGVCAAD